MTNASRQPIERLGDIYQLAHDEDPDPSFNPSYANLIKPWQDITLKGL